MAYNHKAELSKPERFVGGHRLCAGCGAGIVCRAMTRALDEGDKAVICLRERLRHLRRRGGGLSGSEKEGQDRRYL